MILSAGGVCSRLDVVADLPFLTDACAEVEGSRAVRALAAAVDLPWDLNADGRVDADERERDYAFVTHATGGLVVFDLTQRSGPQLVARVRLPLVTLGVAIDRAGMRAYVSGAAGGLAIVDFATLATRADSAEWVWFSSEVTAARRCTRSAGPEWRCHPALRCRIRMWRLAFRDAGTGVALAALSHTAAVAPDDRLK